jgi:hypothetical protein
MFLQRYYIDESYSTTNDSPIFMYLCGEAACTKNELDGTIRTLAQKHHAKLIALEHRYYGKSLPTKTFSSSNLQYLTYENVLNDISYFQKEIISRNNWTGKWVVFGGSYAGTLAAFYREKFPELLIGSIASSAPVMTKETVEEFDEHTTKIVGQKCADNMRIVINQIETALTDNRKMQLIKAMFHSTAIKDDIDFLEMISTIGESAVQFGYNDMFCKMLEKSSTPLEGYAIFTNFILNQFNVDPVSLTPQGAMSEYPSDYEGIAGFRQWNYQVCVDFGAWPIANRDPKKSTRSKYLNVDYYQNICKRLFNLDMKPNTDKLNKSYYEPLLEEEVSNIYFTNGSNDPWSKMSLIDENGNTTNKNLSYYLIEGGSHISDLNIENKNDSESLKNARVKMDELIKKWLENSSYNY